MQFHKKAYGSNQFQDLPGISIICHLAGIRAILITKTRTKMIAIHILKLKLKYSKKTKLCKNYTDSWLNELKLELNNAKMEMN